MTDRPKKISFIVKDTKTYMNAEEARYHYIPKSVLDYSWMDSVEARGRLLFIAEGLFMYLQEEQIKALMIELTDRFPGSYMLFDTVG